MKSCKAWLILCVGIFILEAKGIKGHRQDIRIERRMGRRALWYGFQTESESEEVPVGDPMKIMQEIYSVAEAYSAEARAEGDKAASAALKKSETMTTMPKGSVEDGTVACPPSPELEAVPKLPIGIQSQPPIPETEDASMTEEQEEDAPSSETAEDADAPESSTVLDRSTIDVSSPAPEVGEALESEDASASASLPDETSLEYISTEIDAIGSVPSEDKESLGTPLEEVVDRTTTGEALPSTATEDIDDQSPDIPSEEPEVSLEESKSFRDAPQSTISPPKEPKAPFSIKPVDITPLQESVDRTVDIERPADKLPTTVDTLSKSDEDVSKPETSSKDVASHNATVPDNETHELSQKAKLAIWILAGICITIIVLGNFFGLYFMYIHPRLQPAPSIDLFALDF